MTETECVKNCVAHNETNRVLLWRIRGEVPTTETNYRTEECGPALALPEASRRESVAGIAANDVKL